MGEKLDPERATRIEHRAEIIQAGAQHVASRPMFSIDLDQNLNTRFQLHALVLRTREHLEEVLTPEQLDQISAISGGVEDCEAALRGIAIAIDSAKPGMYGPREKAAIARRSYGVLHQYVTHRDWEVKLNGQKTLNPWRLELVEEPVPFVRVGSASEPTYDFMPCPAFRGEPTGAPRLPRQLWPRVIDIYEECGEFGEIPGEEILAETN